MKRSSKAVVSALVPLVAVLSSPARADGTVKAQDDHPHYIAEIEPEAVFRNDNYFASGFGPGVRASFPIVDPGFIKGLNNTIAIGTGFEALFLNDCYYRNETGCGETLFSIPLVMQWNFYLTPHISVFAEPGVELNFYSVNGCPAGDACNDYYSRTHFAPFTFAGGMRYHFNDIVAITPRVGFDNYGAFMVSFGVSLFAGHK